MLIEIDRKKTNREIKKRCDKVYPKTGVYNNKVAYKHYSISKPSRKGFYQHLHFQDIFSTRECSDLKFQLDYTIVNHVEWYFENEILLLESGKERLKALAEIVNPRTKWGVSDNIDQILKHYPELKTSERLYVVEYNILTPETHGGWRWHKNGEYIGKQKPKHEHLGDEKNITEIMTFTIHELKAI